MKLVRARVVEDHNGWFYVQLWRLWWPFWIKPSYVFTDGMFAGYESASQHAKYLLGRRTKAVREI